MRSRELLTGALGLAVGVGLALVLAPAERGPVACARCADTVAPEVGVLFAECLDDVEKPDSHATQLEVEQCALNAYLRAFTRVP